MQASLRTLYVILGGGIVAVLVYFLFFHQTMRFVSAKESVRPFVDDARMYRVPVMLYALTNVFGSNGRAVLHDANMLLCDGTLAVTQAPAYIQCWATNLPVLLLLLQVNEIARDDSSCFFRGLLLRDCAWRDARLIAGTNLALLDINVMRIEPPDFDQHHDCVPVGVLPALDLVKSALLALLHSNVATQQSQCQSKDP